MIRETVVVGRMAQGETRLSVRCAWCQKFATVEDERAYQNGALLTHSICRKCESKCFPEGAA